MKLLLILFFIGLVLYFFHKVLLWLEQKGFIYYRHKKSHIGMVGIALQELNVILQPTSRHTIEMKQNEIKYKRSETDVPSKSIN